MAGRLRIVLGAAAIAAAAVYVAWLGFGVQTMGDYPGDYAPAMNALLGGHVGAFFSHLPTNGAGGSVLLRAPAALIGKLAVGGQHAIFRFGALTGVLAVALLGAWLARGMRLAGRPQLARMAVLVLCVLSPAIFEAILFGHPEEPLGAALCVVALLLAERDRPGLAGLALGLAVINKPWGVLAVLPVCLAAQTGRLRMAVASVAIAAAWVAAAYLGSPAQFARAVTGASTSVVAHPFDLWWPLAHLHTAPGVTSAYFPPTLISAHARELTVLLALPLSGLLMRARRRTADDCLALLALLFLLRCLLDPSNHIYYQLPFVITLTAWEARSTGFPLLALVASGLFWLTFHTVAGVATLNVQFVLYLTTALGLGAALAGPALGAQGRLRMPAPARQWRPA